MNEQKKIQWHAPFAAATRLQLREDKDLFVFEEEYRLSSKPLEMDLLIIKKVSDAEPKNEIAKIFRTHNIVEYKSPGDKLNIDTWYKTIAYAGLYKSLGEHTDARKAEDITVTLIREKKPAHLFALLRSQYGIEIQERYEGIYYLTGKVLFPTQFIETARLRKGANTWLQFLTRNATSEMVNSFLKQSNQLQEQGEIAYADAITGLMLQSGKQLFVKKRKEKTQMTPTLARFVLQEEIEEYEAQLKKKDNVIAKQDSALAKQDSALRKRMPLSKKKTKRSPAFARSLPKRVRKSVNNA